MGCLPIILSVLDFSTIKNEVFPVVAAVFSKTSSLGIKIRGLGAFVILCGGSVNDNTELNDGLHGAMPASTTSKPNSITILDKYTVQEKVVPLLRAMKTKEPAVMMAALAVLKQVSKIADIEYLAMEVLPILWSFSLGPLLNLNQFQEFTALIKSVSSKIEQEQTRKLRDLSSSNGNGIANGSRSNDLMNMGSTNALHGANGFEDVGESDFERLVLGRGDTSARSTDLFGTDPRPQPQRAHSNQAQAPVFSWSTPVMSPTPNTGPTSHSNQGSQSMTPDSSMNAFAPLQPTSMNAAKSTPPIPQGLNSYTNTQIPTPVTPWPSAGSPGAPSSTFQNLPHSHFSVAPQQTQNVFSHFSLAPPPAQTQRNNPILQHSGPYGAQQSHGASQSSMNSTQQTQKKGLDAYESLI